MSETRKAIAIVAAMQREVAPLVKGWHRIQCDYEGRRYEFFENRDRVLICGGIGAEAARHAAQATIALYRPERIISAGFAGSLHRAVRVGHVFRPAMVVDAGDCSRLTTIGGEGVLVSFKTVAGAAQKSKLAAAFSGQAVDMEAAAVGAAAAIAGIEFSAIKAISDDLEFEMPMMERFVDGAGQFQTTRFALAVAVRPWLWRQMAQLALNSGIASRALCRQLERESRRTADGVALNSIRAG